MIIFYYSLKYKSLNGNYMRQGKRFYEKRKDHDRQISVTFIQQFYPSKTYIGKMFDLSDKAVKVLIDKKFENELLSYMPGKCLTKFRFADNYKVTVSITNITRIDSAIQDKEDERVLLRRRSRQF